MELKETLISELSKIYILKRNMRKWLIELKNFRSWSNDELQPYGCSAWIIRIMHLVSVSSTSLFQNDHWGSSRLFIAYILRKKKYIDLLPKWSWGQVLKMFSSSSCCRSSRYSSSSSISKKGRCSKRKRRRNRRRIR